MKYRRDREVQRVRTSIYVDWGLTEKRQRSGTITSLSSKGCFVQTKIEALYGKTIFIRLWLPTGRWMLLRGEVIYYLRSVGFAVRFTELTDEDSGMLNLLVEYFRQAGTPPAEDDE